MKHDYRLLGQLVSETPWQILPSKLHEIQQFWSRVLAGDVLSDAEIEEITSAAQQRRSRPAAGSIGVLPLYGSIFPKANLMADISGGTSLDAFAAVYRGMMADPNIAAVVMDVDSPGGSAAMLTETAAIIRKEKTKPLVAVANTMAASAAFGLAAQADEFVASPSAVVGSVGTYMLHQDLTAALEAEGVKITAIQSSPAKTETAPFVALSDEAQQALQHMVDQYQAIFVSDIAKGRGTTDATVRKNYGDGRLLTAQDALAAGMVDRVDTFEKVVTGLLKSNGSMSMGRSTAFIPARDGERELVGVGEAVAAASADFRAMPVEQLREVFFGLLPAGATPAPKGSSETDALAEPVKELDAIPASVQATAAAVTSRATATAPTPKAKEATVKSKEELVAQRETLAARTQEINTEHSGTLLEGEPRVEYDEAMQAIDQIDITLADLAKREADQARIGAVAEANKDAIEGGNGAVARKSFGTNADRKGPQNIWDLAGYQKHARSLDELAGLYADGAKRANETVLYATDKQERPKSFVEQLLGADSKDAQFAQRMIVTSDPAFDKAFGKLVMGRPLSNAEQSLINQAVTITGLGAETPVPVQIDPTVLLTSDGVANPMRAISRNVTITGNTWRGISSDGVTVDYAAELAEVTAQTPTFDAPDVTVVKAQAEVQFSIEADEDWGALRSELALMFQDAKDTKEANKFLFGDGSDEPEGLITALTTDGTSIIDTASVNTLAISDLDLVVDDLPPRFDANAQWIGNRGVYSALRALAGSRLDFWVPLAQGFRNRPQGTTGYTLIDYPVNVASEMSRAVTTGSEKVLVLGDFGRGFVIVDRVGLNVELDPLVRNSNGKLIGARALYVYFRNTSALRTPNAFRMLRIKHS
jgi:HK97 family phage major capsid protein